MAKSKFIGDDEEAQAYVVIKREDRDDLEPDDAEPGDEEQAEDDFLEWADLMDKRDAELSSQRADQSPKDKIVESHAATAGRAQRDQVRELLARVQRLRTQVEQEPDNADAAKELAVAERELRKLRAAARGVEAAALPKPRARDQRADALALLALRGVDITKSPSEGGEPMMARSDSYVLTYLRALRLDDVREEGGKYCAYDDDGDKIGEYDTRDEAEAAIEEYYQED